MFKGFAKEVLKLNLSDNIKIYYVNDIIKDSEKNPIEIYGMIFVPDYNFEFLTREMKELEKAEIRNNYNIIKYSELYEFFNKKENIQIIKEDLYFDRYYEDFIRCIKNHTFSNISEKNKTEMERKFIYVYKKMQKHLKKATHENRF